MRRAQLTIPVEGTHEAQDTWNVYDNGGDGGAVSYATAINAAPLRLRPGNAAETRWLDAGWLSAPWLRSVTPSGWLWSPWLTGLWLDERGRLTFVTEELYFGAYTWGVVASDPRGNEQSGAAADVSLVINEAPDPPADLRHTDQDGSVAIFSFLPSLQLSN